ncbi:hypothetical protein GPJ56_000355 [Histomonas meleagridis]|uniref:uncharacterized protein n=1 Tax=Histomonas meleagridis TaxID=135588 RepID=UPI003559701C|nr:hypothetical protein GPJ56_000355 [Histomonas meleagridis]KAH0806378.1 hypothetical protein GO595_000825 [Histomonas meleagridis]
MAKATLKLISLAKNEETVKVHMELVDKYPDITFKSFLSIASDIAEYNTPNVFRKFASVMQHTEAEVRESAINSLTNALKNPNTPIQFLALFTLSATDPYEKNLIEAKKQLSQAIHFRRTIQKKTKTNSSQIAPETALPFVIYLLAHHQNFDDDLPDLPTFDTYLRFFLTPLCADTSDFGKILEIFFHMKFLEDVEVEYTDKLIKLCDLGSSIVKEIGGGRNWNLNTQETTFEFSSRYFKQAVDKDRVKALVKQSNVEIIKSPSKGGQLLRAGMSPLLKKPKTKTNKSLSGKSAPSTPPRKAKTKYEPKTPQPKAKTEEIPLRRSPRTKSPKKRKS